MTKSSVVARPNKPRHDFPLTPRGDGRWCKRVRGKLHYFTGTAQEAIDEWRRVKDDLLAGRTPRPKHDSRPTIADVVNPFLAFKKSRMVGGEITSRTIGVRQ